MITTVTTSTDTTAAAAAMKQSLGMNKDDFMKLFIAQLQYQDPLEPQDPSAMLDQLSQLSLVEQSYNSNTALNNLLTAQNNSISLSAVSFIGGTVKANGNAVSFDGSSTSTLAYNLSSSADTVTISISDSSGTVVRSFEAGAQSSGDQTCTWDGKDTFGTTLSSGAYTHSIAASSSGTSVTATTYTTGSVSGVSFLSDTPTLTVGAVSVPLADVISVQAAGMPSQL
ncbi:MAG: flagellar hook assembly protein FlgD [Desulfuromonadaceae bacterium]|nr:flagellar hook assembly protein FlgD [Desulfuromonadaceae bacterium]MDD5107231.1 flagellar hook assembly protein FlgD [Desulfuromonadaceae bacterium]